MAGKNARTVIYVVHEREGPSLISGFLTEEDANNYFNHAVAEGSLSEQWYKVSPMPLEDMGKQLFS